MTPDSSLLDTAQRLADAERRGDVPALEQIIGADYTGYDPSGRHQEHAGGRVRVTTLGQTELSARVVGDVGLVTGVSAFRGHQGNEPFDFQLRFLDVYAWRDARWQLIASQDTRLPR